MTEAFTVSHDDLVILARIASNAKVARHSIDERDARIAEAITDDGLELAAVARAARLTPAEVAAIVFAQEHSDAGNTRMARTGGRPARRRTSTAGRRRPALA